MSKAPGLINSEAEEFGALAPGSKKLNLIKGKDIEQQVYGGVENRLGTVDYVIEEVPLDRTQRAIGQFYPEGVRAKRLKPMDEKNHPLKGLDTASFGKPTEGVTDPRHPKK